MVDPPKTPDDDAVQAAAKASAEAKKKQEEANTKLLATQLMTGGFAEIPLRRGMVAVEVQGNLGEPPDQKIDLTTRRITAYQLRPDQRCMELKTERIEPFPEECRYEIDGNVRKDSFFELLEYLWIRHGYDGDLFAL